MEFLSSEGLTLGAVLAGIIAIMIEAEFEILASFLMGQKLTYRIGFLIANNFYSRTVFYIALSALIAGVLAILQATLGFALWANKYLVGVITFASATWIAQWRFARLGFHSAQLSVEKGTDYGKSLRLCREKFSFLGTGAAKLTSDDNFEPTLVRINTTNVQSRFLLSRPSNKFIEGAEKMAGVADTQYSINIKKSLSTLKHLKESRNVAIEVRFYPAKRKNDFQDFRMMFVDENVLLLSINAYGKGSGSRLPQIVLRRASFTSSERSMYFAFKSYYDRLWEVSEPWDFKSIPET